MPSIYVVRILASIALFLLFIAMFGEMPAYGGVIPINEYSTQKLVECAKMSKEDGQTCMVYLPTREGGCKHLQEIADETDDIILKQSAIASMNNCAWQDAELLQYLLKYMKSDDQKYRNGDFVKAIAQALVRVSDEYLFHGEYANEVMIFIDSNIGKACSHDCLTIAERSNSKQYLEILRRIKASMDTSPYEGPLIYDKVIAAMIRLGDESNTIGLKRNLSTCEGKLCMKYLDIAIRSHSHVLLPELSRLLGNNTVDNLDFNFTIADWALVCIAFILDRQCDFVKDKTRIDEMVKNHQFYGVVPEEEIRLSYCKLNNIYSKEDYEKARAMAHETMKEEGLLPIDELPIVDHPPPLVQENKATVPGQKEDKNGAMPIPPQTELDKTGGVLLAAGIVGGVLVWRRRRNGKP